MNLSTSFKTRWNSTSCMLAISDIVEDTEAISLSIQTQGSAGTFARTSRRCVLLPNSSQNLPDDSPTPL